MRMWGAGKPKTKPKKDSKVFKFTFSNQLFVTVQPRCGSPPMAAIAELRRDYLSHVRPRILGPAIAQDPGYILLYSRNNFTSRRAIRENDQLYGALVSACVCGLRRSGQGGCSSVCGCGCGFGCGLEFRCGYVCGCCCRGVAEVANAFVVSIVVVIVDVVVWLWLWLLHICLCLCLCLRLCLPVVVAVVVVLLVSGVMAVALAAGLVVWWLG